MRFIEAVVKLEGNKKAQGLTLQSFLVLPMQRITRLPLLVNVSTLPVLELLVIEVSAYSIDQFVCPLFFNSGGLFGACHSNENKQHHRILVTPS